MDYAIIETGGKQYWVAPGETLRVEKLEAQPGQELTFKALWAAQGSGEGAEPRTSTKAQVTAEVVGALRGRKIIVFRKKPKKAYQKTRGHRQNLTEIRIKTINFN